VKPTLIAPLDPGFSPLVLARQEYGVPLVAINDGEVSALAGGQYLGKSGVLGLAMGSSEAVGYLNTGGRLETWLNELAFCPVDVQSNGGEDEWSKDIGVGAMYFSRQIYETIGIYLGYSMATYREFYDFRELLLLGRVSSGKGGDVIVERARAVLAAESPELGLKINLPDEKFRRVGQSIAARLPSTHERSIGSVIGGDSQWKC